MKALMCYCQLLTAVINMTWHPFCDLPLSLRASLLDVDAQC